MNIVEEMKNLKSIAEKQMEKTPNREDLEAIRLNFMGKKGEFTKLMKQLGQLSKEDRPTIGKQINEAREHVMKLIEQRHNELLSLEKKIQLENERIDVTEPRPIPNLGAKHPITLALESVLDCFVGLGFEVKEGPEIELDKFNFELLNLPKDHPARDAQDTFYINENTLLRTHTSPVQARTMLSQKPPIRMVCPGRVYRADEVDATHSPVFHQIEGLVIDENVTMGDLRGTLDAFAKKLYGNDISTRFRPSFFPFTEPSAEVDLTCMACKGKGCSICKGTGWIEVLGSGMVNPKVLEMCGIDSKRYSGFAFGIGLERIAMMRYGIHDMRMLYENDARFLKQMRG